VPNLRVLIRVALLAALLSCEATTGAGTREPRILVFSKTAAYRHASIGPGVAALTQRALRAGVGVDATEDAGVFTEAGLTRYGAVVFLSTTGDVLGAAQQEALEDFMRGGGGFAGIHSASDTEYDWPW